MLPLDVRPDDFVEPFHTDAALAVRLSPAKHIATDDISINSDSRTDSGLLKVFLNIKLKPPFIFDFGQFDK